MAKLTGFIITAGHLDIEWYQPLRSYRYWTIETFEQLKEAAKRDDFISYVLDGQVFPLEEYLDIIPEDEACLRSLIQKGKLAAGPFYTQFDEWLPSAENIIRNCLYGRNRAEFFGGCMKAGYLPDNFGHPRQLPQILRNFGIDSLLFMRGFPEVPGGHPDEFIYRGLDGSEVLASHFRESYAGAFDLSGKKVLPIQPRIIPYYDGKDSYLSFEWHKEVADHDEPERIARNLIANVRRIKDRYPSGVIPLVTGYDHLPPQINIGDSVKAANSMQDEIEFIMGDAEAYIRRVYRNLKNPALYDMELLGSRYQYILQGALSSRSYLKRENFAAEALLERYAEPLDAMASLAGYPHRKRLLEEAWKYLLINSAHDSIHGSSVDEVHKEMEFRFAAIRQIASGLIHDIFSFWARLGENPKRAVLSYAPTDCNFAQPAELWIPAEKLPVVICTASGEPLPTQILPREETVPNGLGQNQSEAFPADVYHRVLFMDTFESASITMHKIVPDSEERQFSGINASDTFIENEFIRIETSGSLINLFDRKQQVWYRNLNLLVEEADAGDAWDFSPPWIPGETVLSSGNPGVFSSRLAEHGPVRAVLEILGTMSVPSGLIGDCRSQDRIDMPVTFYITLYRGIARADIKLVLINSARDHRIRLRLMPRIKTDFVRSQGQLAILDRNVELQKESEEWRQPAARLFPFREWLAVQDRDRGFCIAVKGLYDYEAANNSLSGHPVDCPEISLTLLRGFGVMGKINTMQRIGGASPAVPVPGAQCPGQQVFEWSYIPFTTKNDEKAPFLPLVQSYLYPPVSYAIRQREPEKKAGTPGKNGVPWSGKLFKWENSNIQFSALKRPLNTGTEKTVILRFFENQGKAVELNLGVHPQFTKARLSNMNEDDGENLEINNHRLKAAIGPYKAVTIKLIQ